ncbi:MAG: c-type cytochrome [Phycisphaerales bacterium]|jgi:DNA-binding beta-propeller fold protein YncE|nr:c-type cytochrome [Phycisphaerales bacterium]
MNVKRAMSIIIGLSTITMILVYNPSTKAVAAPPEPKESYASPVAIVSDGTNLYIPCATSSKILVVNAKTNKFVTAIKTKTPLSGASLSGKTLHATCGTIPGKLLSIDTRMHKIIEYKQTFHAPCAPIVSGKTIYIADRYRNLVINVTNGKTIPVSREPVAMAATPDGKTLLVANLLPAGKANGDYASSLVSLIDTATDKVITELPLANGATGPRGIAIDPEGKFAYITHVLGRYQLPTTQIERGWMNTNAISVIDIAAKQVVNSVLLDDVDFGAANPWGVAVSPDSKTLVVTHAGTHELSIIDLPGLHKLLDEYAKTGRAKEVPNKLSFLSGIRRRVKLPGRGPRSVLILGRIAWVPMYFSDTLVRVDLDEKSLRAIHEIPLGPKVKPSQKRLGEIFFHDGALCLQKWQSCTSCHPDARADSLNWDLLNDGLGNPKQTRTMLFSHYTPPVMITGVRSGAEHAVRSGIRFIQFAVRPESDAKAIDAYLKSLASIPSPLLINGNLSQSAQRGKVVFKAAKCATCHTGVYYTDQKKYDVGLGIDIEKGREFDTPILSEVWRTAPYLYDGRAKTMMDVLTTWNKNDTHGKTSNLSKQQLNDLCEYILSL